MMSNRETFLIGMIGHNRTGKSVTAVQIAKQWKESHTGKIITYDIQNRFGKLTDVDITDTDSKELLNIIVNYPSSLLVLDDYRMLYPSDKTDKDLLRLMHLRNELCIDIIYITHSPSLVLERLTYYTTHYMVFYTLGSDKGFSTKMNGGLILSEIRDAVNRYVKEYGKGTYKENNFKFIIFDAETETITPINMPHLNIQINENN